VNHHFGALGEPHFGDAIDYSSSCFVISQNFNIHQAQSPELKLLFSPGGSHN
jgi:hypothetical protein